MTKGNQIFTLMVEVVGALLGVFKAQIPKIKDQRGPSGNQPSG